MHTFRVGLGLMVFLSKRHIISIIIFKFVHLDYKISHVLVDIHKTNYFTQQDDPNEELDNLFISINLFN